MLDDRQSGLLRDVFDSACSIRTYLSGVNREAFLADAEKQDAVLRRFEIIGEAASRLAPEAQALFPTVSHPTVSRHARHEKHHRP